MLTPRGIAVALAGVAMWVAARILGSPGLETVAIGLAAAAVHRRRVRPLGRRSTIHVQRHLSEPRVAPGTRVTVRLDVAQRRRRQAVVPAARGPAAGRARPARARGRRRRRRARSQRVSYTIVPHARGRYVIGPLAVDRTDAFGLTRRRVLLDGRDELLVTPGGRGPPCAGRVDERHEHRQRARAPAAAHRRGVLHDARLPGGRRPPPDPLALGRADRRADDPPGRGVAPGGRADLPRQPRVDARAGARRRRSSAPCRTRRASARCSPATASRCGSARTRPPITAVDEEAFLDLLAGAARTGAGGRSAAC